MKKDIAISGDLKLNEQGGDIRGHSRALVGGHLVCKRRKLSEFTAMSGSRTPANTMIMAITVSR